ncbi:hypothetical protein T09_501 [Trichinella sp. T9]|nr:hypothetical protein T09_501 [Trichinella sp. T9]
MDECHYICASPIVATNKVTDHKLDILQHCMMHFEAGRKVYQFPPIGDVLLFHKLHMLQLRYLHKIRLFLHLCWNFSSCIRRARSKLRNSPLITEARERKITYFEIEDGIEKKCCVRFLITAVHTETLNNHEDYILNFI